MEIQAGSLISERYRVISRLGAGSMGTVYLAQDSENKGLHIALKILHSHILNDPSATERFRQEMRLAQKLNHPNIIRYYDIGEMQDGRIYLSMEYFPGKSLSELPEIRQQSALSYEKALCILYQAASALTHMHEHRIIHRDIKPGNILIGADNLIKITDLGIAKSLSESSQLTAMDQTIGTPSYMAPERFIQGAVISELVDIYSLGILGYWLVCGKVPFESENSMTSMWQHLMQPMPDLSSHNQDIPAWYQKFIERCSAKKPELRFQSMTEAIQILAPQLKKAKIGIPAAVQIISGAKEKQSLPELIKKISRFIRRKYEEADQNWKNLPVALSITLLSLYLFFSLPGIPSSGILEKSIEFRIVDSYFQLRGQLPAPDSVAIVAITEDSFNRDRQSYIKPFNRERYIELLRKLSSMGAKAAIFDLRFREGLDKELDLRVADAFQILPTYIGKFKSIASRHFNSADSKRSWLLPDEIFAAKAAGIFDGMVRRENGVVRRFMPAYKSSPPDIQLYDIAKSEIKKDYQLPGTGDFINFHGKPGTIKTVSLEDLLNNQNISPDLLRSKYVFIGLQFSLFNLYQSDQQADSFITPFGANTFGVEIHATTLANLLQGNWIRSFPLNYQTLCFIFSGTLISLLILRNSGYASRLMACFIIISWLVICFLFFIYERYIPASGIIFIAAASTLAPRAKSIYEKTASLMMSRKLKIPGRTGSGKDGTTLG